MHTSLRLPLARIRPRTLCAILLSIGSACAGGQKTTDVGAGPVADTGDRSYIGDAQLAASSETAYEIVQRLRPEYLRPDPVVRNATTTHSEPLVVVDGHQIGSVDELRRMPATSLTRIRFYGAEAAKRRFGMQFTTPVLELTYRQR